MKRWRKILEAELEKSDAHTRLTSNAGSNAGVAVGPHRFARPRSRGRGTRGSLHTLRIVPGYREAKVAAQPKSDYSSCLGRTPYLTAVPAEG